MKVLPLTVGPIVGGTTSTRVRLWGRGAYEATPEGPRRACGVARIRSVTGGGFSDPLFFKMNPNFDFLSGDVHASVSAELRAGGGSGTKLVSIVSSPFFWPYPGGPAGLFRLEGTIRAGDLTFELAEAGPVQSADNFTRVTVHPDRVEAEVFSRKGLPLGPPKVHRF